MRRHYEKMLRDTENRVRESFRRQVHTQGAACGGFLDENGIVQAKFAIYRATSAAAAYCNPDSCFYRDEDVFYMVMEAFAYVARSQHENGLFDLVTCNFYSAPDTAFCIKRMMPVLRYLRVHQDTTQEEELYKAMCRIVEKAAAGLLQGGFHTPNHRWAIASQLLECGDFLGNPKMKEQAQRYLREGIDCNAHGEYAEKSAGNYNRINNDAMMTMGHVTGEGEFFGHAVRNLRMMMTYIEPDGSIFTANSTRQDNGRLIYPRDYYTEYLELGLLLDIPEFLDMANYIFRLTEEKGIAAPDQLIHYMNHPDWIDREHEGVWKQPLFRCFYPESGIVRAHREDFTYTLMEGKAVFLHFSTGSLRVEVKLGGGFFEHRAFAAESLQPDGSGTGYHLHQVMHGWYYQPFEEKPETSDWWKMDHTKRKKTSGPHMEIGIDVREIQDGIEIHVKTGGAMGAPFRLEFAVAGADAVSGRQFYQEALPGAGMVLKEGDATFSNGTDCVRIGPGFGTHLLTAGKFGNEPQASHAYTLYMTDFTEFEHAVRMTAGAAPLMDGATPLMDGAAPLADREWPVNLRREAEEGGHGQDAK